MFRRYVVLILLLGLGILIAGCGPGPATATSIPTEVPPSATATKVPTDVPSPTAALAVGVSFSADIQPLFAGRCTTCHSGRRMEAELDLSSYTSLMAGSEGGPVVIPGDAEGSKLVAMVAEGEMPKRGPKLTPIQVQLIVDWINEGAQNN